HAIVGFVNQRWHFDPEFDDAEVSDFVTLLGGLSAFEKDAILDVVLELPGVDRVRLLDVDNVERDPVAIVAIETIERGHRPAEGRSSVAAKHEDDGPIASVRRKGNAPGAVLRRTQAEVWSQIALSKIATAGP